MTRCLALAGLMLVALSVSHAGPADAKTELDGTWDLARLEEDGKEMIPTGGKMVASCTGDKFVLKLGDKVIAAGNFKLEPGQKPKSIDITYTEGADKGKSFPAIYELKGDDLKFCRSTTPGNSRPKDFTAKGAMVSYYKRAKK